MLLPEVHNVRNGSTEAAVLHRAMLRARASRFVIQKNCQQRGAEQDTQQQRRRRRKRHHRTAQQTLQPDQRMLPRLACGTRFADGLLLHHRHLSPGRPRPAPWPEQ